MVLTLPFTGINIDKTDNFTNIKNIANKLFEEIKGKNANKENTSNVFFIL